MIGYKAAIFSVSRSPDMNMARSRRQTCILCGLKKYHMILKSRILSFNLNPTGFDVNISTIDLVISVYFLWLLHMPLLMLIIFSMACSLKTPKSYHRVENILFSSLPRNTRCLINFETFLI